MAALLSGQGVCEVAQRYKLPKGTVSKWFRQARKLTTKAEAAGRRAPAAVAAAGPAQAVLDAEPADGGGAALAQQQAPNLGEEVRQCLVDLLAGIRGIARAAALPDYVRRQPAQELAILLGVMSDKAFRILDAADRAQREQEDAQRPPAAAEVSGGPESQAPAGVPPGGPGGAV